MRFAPWQSRHGFHRFQHFYVWALYGLFPLRWFFIDDFVELATGRIGGQAFPPPRGWDLASMLAGLTLLLWVGVTFAGRGRWLALMLMR